MQARIPIKLFPITLLALAVAFSCSQKHKKSLPDLHKKRPASPVLKSIKHYITDTTGTEMLYEVEEFDKQGHKVRQIRYQANDTMDFEALYTPNEKGNPEKTVTRYLDGTTDTELHTYGENGKAVKTEWTRSDGTRGRHEYRYDDKDSLVQWDRYENGKFILTQLWPNVYDENDRVIESWYKETSNGKDTSTRQHWVYSYDSLGRLTHRQALRGAALESVEEYYYDSMNDVIMMVEYGLDTLKPGRYIPQKRTINSYNEYGELLTSQILDAQGKEMEQTENEYDQYGHLVKSVIATTTENGKTIVQKHRWEYSYY